MTFLKAWRKSWWKTKRFYFVYGRSIYQLHAFLLKGNYNGIPSKWVCWTRYESISVASQLTVPLADILRNSRGTLREENYRKVANATYAFLKHFFAELARVLLESVMDAVYCKSIALVSRQLTSIVLKPTSTGIMLMMIMIIASGFLLKIFFKRLLHIFLFNAK